MSSQSVTKVSRFIDALIPKDAFFLRKTCKASGEASLQPLKRFHVSVIGARSIALFAAISAPVRAVGYSLRGVGNFVAELSQGKVGEAVKKLAKDELSALQCVALTVVAATYSVFGLIFGSWVLRHFIPNVKEREKTVAELKKQAVVLQNNIATKEEQIKKLEEELNTAKENPSHSHSNNCGHQELLQQLHQQQQESEAKIQGLEQKITEKSDKLKALKSEYEAKLSAANSPNSNEIDKLNDEIARLKSEQVKQQTDLQAKEQELQQFKADHQSQINAKESELTQANKEKTDLEQQQQNLEQELKSKKTENENAKQQLKQLTKEITEKTDEVDRLKSAVSGDVTLLNNKINDLNKKIDGLTQQIKDDTNVYNKEKDKLTNELKVAQQQIDQTKDDVSKKEAEIKNLENQKNNLDASIKTLSTENGDKNSQIDVLKNQIETLEKEKNTLEQDLKNHVQQIDTYKNEVEKYKNEIDQLTNNSANNSNQITDLKKELSDAQRKLTEKENEIKKISDEKEKLDESIANLKLDNTNKDNQISDLQEEAYDLAKKHNDLENEIQTKVREIDQYKEKIELLEKDSDGNKKNISSLTYELNTAKLAITAKEKEIETIKKQKEDAEKSLTAWASSGTDKDQLISTLQLKKGELKTNITNLKNQIAAQKNEINVSNLRIDDLETSLQKQKQNADEIAKKHSEELNEVKKNLLKKETELGKKKEEFKRLENERKRLSTSFDLEEVKASNSQKKLEKAQEDLNEVQEKLSQLKERNEKLAEELEQIKQSHQKKEDELNKKIDSQKSEIENQIKRIDDLEKENKDYSDENDAFVKQQRIFESKKEKLEKDKKDLLEEIDALTKKTNSIQEALEKEKKMGEAVLHGVKGVAERNIFKLEEKIEKLSKKVRNLNQQVEDSKKAKRSQKKGKQAASKTKNVDASLKYNTVVVTSEVSKEINNYSTVVFTPEATEELKKYEEEMSKRTLKITSTIDQQLKQIKTIKNTQKAVNKNIEKLKNENTDLKQKSVRLIQLQDEKQKLEEENQKLVKEAKLSTIKLSTVLRGLRVDSLGYFNSNLPDNQKKEDNYNTPLLIKTKGKVRKNVKDIFSIKTEDTADQNSAADQNSLVEQIGNFTENMLSELESEKKALNVEKLKNNLLEFLVKVNESEKVEKEFNKQRNERIQVIVNVNKNTFKGVSFDKGKFALVSSKDKSTQSLNEPTFKQLKNDFEELIQDFKKVLIIYTNAFSKENEAFNLKQTKENYQKLKTAVDQIKGYSKGLETISSFYLEKEIAKKKEELKKAYDKDLTDKKKELATLKDTDQIKSLADEIKEVESKAEEYIKQRAEEEAKVENHDIIALYNYANYHLDLCEKESHFLDGYHKARLDLVTTPDNNALQDTLTAALEHANSYFPVEGQEVDFPDRLKCILNKKCEPTKLLPGSFDSKIVFNGLANVYGERVTKDVFSFYNVVQSKNDGTTGEVISVDKLKAIVVGIQANLTLDDLKAAYEKKDELSNMYQDLVTIDFSQWPKRFNELTEEQTIEFLKLLHTETTTESDGSTKYYTQPFFEQVYKDISFLKACRMESEYSVNGSASPKSPKQNGDGIYPTTELKNEIKHSEYLVRQIAYGLFDCDSFLKDGAKTSFSEGVLLTIPEGHQENGHHSLKQAKKIVDAEGLYGIHLLPTDKGEMKDTPVLYTVYRGTKDYASLKTRDTQTAPGEIEYKRYEKTIREKSKEAIDQMQAMMKRKNNAQKLIIDVAGHSLGAADAGRHMCLLAEMIDKNEIAGIDAIYLNAWNPPGISEQQAKEFIENCKKIANDNKPTKFYALDNKVYGDWVSFGGQKHPGYCNTKDKNFKIEDYPKNIYLSTIKYNISDGSKAVLCYHGSHCVSENFIEDANYPSKKQANRTKIDDVRTNDPRFINFRNSVVGKNYAIGNEDEELRRAIDSKATSTNGSTFYAVYYFFVDKMSLPSSPVPTRRKQQANASLSVPKGIEANLNASLNGSSTLDSFVFVPRQD